jgi:alpha-tubulin suppressor-like RCC1 family protein
MNEVLRCAVLALAVLAGFGGTAASAPPIPLAVPSVVAIAAGLAHTCAITGTGGVKCWGTNSHDELGNGTRSDSRTPVDVSGLGRGVTAIAAGVRHHCALTGAGAVKCWGHSSFGTLGDGTAIRRYTPVDVAGLSTGVTAIAAGGDHTCALTSAGGIKCWGYNRFGALGDGTTVDRWTAVDVAGLGSGVTTIAAGFGQSCAVTGAGGVKCWGSVVGDRLRPVDVPGLGSGVRAVATAGSHSCALMRDGGVKCWGRNNVGQLGDGTLMDRSTPVEVVGLGRNVGAIGTGTGTSCALVMTTRVVRCWGLNDHGQLGDGTTVNRTTPVGVSGLSGVGGIALGSFHSCALTRRGGVMCWGSNAAGQLGDGSTVDRRAPAGVFGLGEQASVVIVSRSAAVNRARNASVKLRCGPQAACEGRLVFAASVDGELVGSAARNVSFELGRRVFAIGAGATRIVTVRLTSRGFRLLARARRLAVEARARYRHPGGGTAKATRTITLRAP